MDAAFCARCIKNHEGLIKGKRYFITAVDDNLFTIEELEAQFDTSLFEIENVYFAFGKKLPEIGQPLKNIIRFTGKQWEKIITTSPIQDMCLLNERTIFITTNHNSYIYQLASDNHNIKFSNNLLNTAPIYFAVGDSVPEVDKVMENFYFLSINNEWKAKKQTTPLKFCCMFGGSNTYLFIDSSNTMYVYKVR